MEELSSHAVLWLRPPMTLIKRSLAENDDAAFRGVETVFSIENERLNRATDSLSWKGWPVKEVLISFHVLKNFIFPMDLFSILLQFHSGRC